jgi:cyclin H
MLQSSTPPDASSAAKVPLFQNSTQYKNWRFSVKQLTATRTALNQGAVAAIRNTFESDSVCTRRS